MLRSVAGLCRCSAPLRAGPGNFVGGWRSGFNTTIPVRQLITSSRSNIRNGGNIFRNSRLSQFLKSNGMLVRYCASAPKPQSKIVGYWLLGCSGMVFAAVVLGGVTRLTESGLSMVTWKLLGEKMPTTEEEWAAEFAKYQEFPEFKYKNQNMTLSEFKWIWWMEYGHRSWGRLVGAAVGGGAVTLWAAGLMPREMRVRAVACCLLVGAQGLMGWYMVKSGLEDRFQGPSDVPRVSQYRLAAHLSLAFILYMGLLAGALKVLRPGPVNATVTNMKFLKSLSTHAHIVKGMVFLTAVSGAFVAGLDAGLVYNSFPLMGDTWVPADVLALSPVARNVTDNPATVQLEHRLLATGTLAAVAALWVRTRTAAAPRVLRPAAAALAAAAAIQVSLGIATLLHYVPTGLAACHQAGSLVLLSTAVWLTHEIKLLKYIPK